LNGFLPSTALPCWSRLPKPRVQAPAKSVPELMVRRDGRFSGTMGGGALEWLVLAEAQQMLAGRGFAG